MPAPPYPADTVAKGYHLHFDYQRVTQSSTWKLANPTPEVRPWLLMLWFEAWQQRPVASLPDDDEEIAAIIGMPMSLFALHRKILMRGWTRHDDGRLYHKILTDLALTMVRERKAYITRQNRHRQPVELPAVTRDNTVTPPVSHADVDVDVDVNAHRKSKPRKVKTSVATASQPLPDWLPRTAWQDFLQMRGPKMTARAKELAIAKLAAMRDGGQDPKAVLEQSVMNGWTSLLPLKSGMGGGVLTAVGERTAANLQRWKNDEDAKDEKR